MKGSAILIVIGFLYCTFGCTSDKNNPLKPVEEVVDSITWVGTDLIYNNSGTKKSYTAIFIYTDWCGWSKKMKSEVLTDSDVINTLHNHFNSIKINPDIDSSVVYKDNMVTCSQYVREVYPISGFPTIIILNRFNQEITRIRGYHPPQDVLEVLETVKACGFWCYN